MGKRSLLPLLSTAAGGLLKPTCAIIEAPSALGHVPEHLGVERAPAVLLEAGLATA
jgi:hypothetical protein